jgi:Protein of unknown function (DUF2971)
MTAAEIAQKFRARANPPALLFRYRPPAQRTLDEISKQQIHIAKSDELNDPFECSARVVWDFDLLRQKFILEYAPKHGLSVTEAGKEFDLHSDAWREELPRSTAELIKQSGIICLSAIPDSIRMWSYYAQSHKGICIGYDTRKRPFYIAMEVKYQNPDTPLEAVAALKIDPTEVAAHTTLRKAEEWMFEQEYRIPVNIQNMPRLVSVESGAISEIRFGARVTHEFKQQVLEAISYLPNRPKLIQMGCDFDRFILTETVI